MQLKLQDRVKFAVIFWSITVVAAVYFIPALIFSAVNPFWFRDAFIKKLSNQITRVSVWRSKQVKPIVDKYVAFELLKKKNIGEENASVVSSK